jgi:hypothetical protein
MAEEGTLGQARAAHDRADDDEPSKEELQRRMEQARESITQTVTEIKETVTNQYYSVKESVSDALDWRHHFRKRPIAFSIGALSVGFLVGYGIAAKLKGHSDDDSREDYPSYEESDVYARAHVRPLRVEDGDDEAVRHTAFHGHSYAAQPITDSSSQSAENERRPSNEGAGDYSSTRGDSDSHSAAREEKELEDKKPGLFARFKETSAYDRLQAEVSSLGERFIEQLFTTAQTVVLPALFGKIKELFGVDLSNQQAQRPQSQSGSDHQTRQTGGAGASQTASTQAASASTSSATNARSQSYATSENRGYGAQSSERAANSGGGDSVLDLDR